MAALEKLTRTRTEVIGYTLTLTHEEALHLGALRYSHVEGGSKLYAILKDMPVDLTKPATTFTVEQGIVTDLPQPKKVEAMAEALRAMMAAPVGMLRRKWKVQYTGHSDRYWNDMAHEWKNLSRNEAYRKLRRLIAQATKGDTVNLTTANGAYRVVPMGTHQGVDNHPGGYYPETYDRTRGRYVRSTSVTFRNPGSAALYISLHLRGFTTRIKYDKNA